MKTTFLRKLLLLSVLIMTLTGAALIAFAQDTPQLAASLEVIEGGVEVMTVNTVTWVPIKVETIINQGDRIRTDATGEALLTFFDEGNTVVLEPNTEVRIAEFTGAEDRFSLDVEVLLGVTRQQFERLVDSDSSYEVLTPGVAMTVRGTDFSVRVEDDGRSALLTHEGLVYAYDSGTEADVSPGYGIRSAVGAFISDVVPATTFEELDTALDGCAGGIATPADVKLNVRLGPGLDNEIVGTVTPAAISNIIGSTVDQSWYRIPFRNGYGWVSAAGMEITVDSLCPGGLAIYASDKLEDPSRYGLFGESETIGVVSAATANLRAGPGVDFDQIGQVYAGDQVVIIGRNEDSSWRRIRLDSEKQAWIATFLVQVNSDIGFIGVVPVEETPTVPTAEPDEALDDSDTEPDTDTAE